MEEVETRISHLEDEAGSQQVTRESMEKQLEDTQWKLTDLEDRLRRNNLRVLGIPAKHDMPKMTEILLIEAINCGANIGMIYTLLVDLQSDDMAHQNERWTTRFCMAGDWMDQSLAMADTTLLSANLKTQHYKTLVDLYYTPAKLKEWGETSGLCTHCGEEEAKILHMFYACPMLRVFLCGIEVFLKKIAGCNVQLSVMLVLLRIPASRRHARCGDQRRRQRNRCAAAAYSGHNTRDPPMLGQLSVGRLNSISLRLEVAVEGALPRSPETGPAAREEPAERLFHGFRPARAEPRASGSLRGRR
ncbi:hypothetical protein NDU88_008305 [Pleurodeles waltl]|uniref:Reverse transcriptase zinc-binding domain-containing protein n=1 Tax=Pleurodeles waltl TaxID=8319 RepID=A0AAV7SUQ3_PLEWA|nr:hypothetical protein NDU88_008305 [Pleurodeles waltl]